MVGAVLGLPHHPSPGASLAQGFEWIIPFVSGVLMWWGGFNALIIMNSALEITFCLVTLTNKAQSDQSTSALLHGPWVQVHAASPCLFRSNLGPISVVSGPSHCLQPPSPVLAALLLASTAVISTHPGRHKDLGKHAWYFPPKILPSPQLFSAGALRFACLHPSSQPVPVLPASPRECFTAGSIPEKGALWILGWGERIKPSPWVGSKRFKPAPSSLELSQTLAVVLSGLLAGEAVSEAGFGAALGSANGI